MISHQIEIISLLETAIEHFLQLRTIASMLKIKKVQARRNLQKAERLS